MGIRRILKKTMSSILALSMIVGSAPVGVYAEQSKESRESSVDLTEGLVGYWTFDGGTENDEWLKSSVTDGLVATKTENGVSLSETGGIVGGGVDFAGVRDTYLTLKLKDANVPITSAVNDTGFAIGAWVNYRTITYDGAANVPTSVFHLDGDSAGQPILSIGSLSNGDVYNTNLGGVLKFSTQTIETQKWHHVMAVYQSGRIYFYINGELKGNEQLAGAITYGDGNRAGDIRVGYHRANDSAAVDGVMDEIRYYNKAISADVVQAIYNEQALRLDIDSLKEELSVLLARAQNLSGGTEDSEVALSSAKTAAENLVNGELQLTEAVKMDLIQKKEALKSAINQYHTEENASIPIRDGLVGYWTFEGDSEAGSLASKAFVQNVTAAKTGTGVTLSDTGGISGKAVSFTGDNTSWLTLNLNDANKGLMPSTNAFTLGAWIKYEQMDTSSAISVFHQDGTSTGRAILTISNHDSGAGMRYGTYLKGGNNYSAKKIMAGEWHHVVIAVDAAGSDRKAKIYVNGTLTNETDAAISNLVDGSGNIRVGAHRQNSTSPAIKGVMDEICYYDRTLSAEEIASVYSAYGMQYVETAAIRAELQELITEARALTGGTQAAETALNNVIEEITTLLEDSSTNVAAFTEKKTALENAITAYEESIQIEVTATAEQGNGTVTGTGSYSLNADVTITATPNEGYRFIGWYKGEETDAVSTETSYTFQATENVALTAKFEKLKFDVTVDAGAGGTASGGDTQIEYNEEITVTASPAEGYEFTGWYKDGEPDTAVSTNASYTFQVTENVTLTAKFEKKKFAVTVQAEEGGTANGGGAQIEYGSETTVTATPNEGYSFLGWYVGDTVKSADAEYTFIVTETVTLTAKFRDTTTPAERVDITVRAETGGSADPVTQNVEVGSNATVTATPETGYEFLGWYKGTEQISTSNPYIFMVAEGLDLTAKFEKKQIAVTVTANPSEGGTVSGADPNVEYGTSITVTAAANTAYRFAGWYSGDSETAVSTNTSYTFEATEDITLTARFEKKKFAVTVTANPPAGGTVSGGSQEAEYGTQVTVTATPNESYEFLGWYVGDTLKSSNASYTFTVTAALALTAKFEYSAPPIETVAVTVHAETGGTVSGGKSDAEVGSDITVTATPNPGYEFSGWYQGETKVSDQASYTFEVAEEVTLTAKFSVRNVNVVTEGLVGYWTFEGDSETERLASKASVANVNAAKTGEGVTLPNSGGISGGAVSFAGNNTSWLTLNLTGANKGLTPSTNAFTIGAWIKYGAMEIDSQNAISVFHQDGTDTGRAILTIGKNGQNGMRYGTYLAASNQFSTENIVAEEWHHVVIAVDAPGTGRKAKIYVNGKLTNEADSTLAANLVNGSGNIRVGAHRQNTSSQAVNGIVDEIRYYDRAISAEEVKTIYDVYGDTVEAENLKQELLAMLEAAKEMTGGSEEATEALNAIITEIETWLENNPSANSEALEQKAAELQAAIDAYEAGTPVVVAVDTTDELREIPSAMFGINHRYHNYGYGSWDNENDKIFDDFNRLAKEASFGSVRYPGGTVSNLFTWKDSIGPKDERTTIIAGNNFYSGAGETPVDPAFGVDEAMKWIYDDLKSEAIFVYGFGRGNPQDAADLVEYLNAPNDGSNPNGGVDWAAVRAENGHEEPYGVIRFELGNEFSDTGQNYWMSGLSEHNKGVVDLYIEGDRMTISGQQSYYQLNNKVAKKGDWRDAASKSDGKPNEERYVYYLPVVENTATVFVAGTEWEIVDTFSGQGKRNVCTFDYETGKITFGDGTNGNIPSAGAQITCNYKTDQSGFVDYYDAMKSVADEIGTDIEIYSGIFDGRQNDFIDKMHQKGYDNKYDGVIIHPYSSGVSSYEDSLARAKGFSNNIATYKNKMHTVTGDDRKKVAVSEFGILSVTPASNYQTSIGHAIYIANHMIDCVNSGAAYQNKHCLVDTTGSSDNLGAWQQCVIQSHQTDNGYQYVSTPSAQLFSIFNNMTGSIEVDQTITGNKAFTGSGNNTVMSLNVYSTKDEYGNTYVMAVNNKETSVLAVDISVDELDLTGKEIDVWYLTSENVTDMNTLAEPDKITVQKTTVNGSGTSINYVLQPHSVYSFKIPAEKTTVTVTAGENGAASGGKENAAPGEEITVTATPDDGYDFVGWFADDELVSSEREYTFCVPKEGITLEARFSSPVEITIETETGGTASDSLTAAVGREITVTAHPNMGYEFDGWYQGTEKVCETASYTFVVSEAVTLTAKFVKKKFAVTVTAQTGGTVSGGSQEAEYGTEVTVSATANEGYEFIGWYQGTEKVSDSASYTFTVESAVSLMAKFKKKQEPVETVAINVEAEEGGTVSGGKTDAEVGSRITVKARPDAGYEFDGWYQGTEKVSENTSYTFTVESALTLTAKFKKKQEPAETADIKVEAEEGGAVSGGKEGIEIGTNLTVTAEPSEGYEFDGWYLGEEKVSEELSYTFKVEESITLTAKFVKKQVSVEKVKVTVKTTAGGTVSGTTEVAVGSKVTVKATANAGYSFAGWYNGSVKVSQSATYTFQAKTAITLTAKFTRKMVSITVKAGVGGKASGSATAAVGSKATVKAFPNTGYEFAGWYIGSKIVSRTPTYTFTVTGAVVLTASFKKKADTNVEEQEYKVGKFYYQIIDEAKKTVKIIKGTNNKAKKLVIPATVKINKVTYKVVQISESAFLNYTKLTDVTIGKNITTIQKNAFKGCKKLKKVILKGTKLKTIQKGAFAKTSSKMSVKVPKGLKGKKGGKLLNKLKKAGMNKKTKIK